MNLKPWISLLTSFVLGLATKLAIALVLAAMVIFGVRWYWIRQVTVFCSDHLVGLSRGAVEQRAMDSGLRYYRGKVSDEVVQSEGAPVLVWCIMAHEGDTIRSVKVAVD